MAADTFSITLFSDVDCDKFGNTSTSFTNALPIPIDVSSGRYVVGLVELGFQSEALAPVEEEKIIAPTTLLPLNDIPAQQIKIWYKETMENSFIYTERKNLSGLITYLNQQLETEEKFKLRILEEILDPPSVGFKVIFSRDGASWLEITPEFAQLIGVTNTRILEGETLGVPVDPTIYDKLGKPEDVKFNVCKSASTIVITESIQPGFEEFLDKWSNAIKIPQASFTLVHDYSGDLVFLEVIVYSDDEKMQLSPKMNQLMNLPDDYIFDHTILLSFPKSNFLPVPPAPPPTPIIVDPDKFIYISCNIIEQQACGGSLIPILKVLPRNKDKTSVQQRFEPVIFLPALRQLVNSVTICISNRTMQPLATTKEPTYCVLSFKLAA